MFDTQEEAQQKIVETIILHKGLPIWVQSAKKSARSIVIYYYYVDDAAQETRTADITDPDLDFRTVGEHLGYLNVNEGPYKEALYLRRTPVRRSHQTQGLSRHNLFVPITRGSTSLGIPQQRFAFNQVWKMSTFVHMFKNEYPSLRQIRLAFTKEQQRISAAFHARLAINRSPTGVFNLEYKGQDIGYTEDLETFKLGPEYRHLRESLDEAGLRVAA